MKWKGPQMITLQKVMEKLSYFDSKYNKRFFVFEEYVKSQTDENLEVWEDYMEHQKSFDSLNHKKKRNRK